ncbi:MAG TPA: hypothetical protein VIC58_10080 [Actinomycetota bacterium]|jgi:hypothetical protein
MLAAPLDAPVLTLTEPVHAWRTWTLTGSTDGSDVRLLPIAGDGRPWPLRRAATAACTRRRAHAVPDLDCTCGIHAVIGPDLLRRTRDPAVLGTVALWGRIVEHLHGYRAAFGYPQRLRLACHLCLSMWGSRVPGACSVVVRHRGGRMVPLCAPHLELSRRYRYPMPRLLPAKRVEGALLSSYAVDLLPS